MRFKFLIIPSVFLLQMAEAQNGSATYTSTQAPVNSSLSASPSTPDAPAMESSSSEVPADTRVKIIDYKSVFEAPTVEEEVKIATERFSLTPAQQDTWLMAATERRASEKQAKDKLDSKADNYQKSAVYSGLRASHNAFHETIIAYLTPAQKQALETDRLIQQDRQMKLANQPPPVAAPAATVTPVDSAATKEPVKGKGKSKKSKSKKKAVAS